MARDATTLITILAILLAQQTLSFNIAAPGTLKRCFQQQYCSTTTCSPRHQRLQNHACQPASRMLSGSGPRHPQRLEAGSGSSGEGSSSTKEKQSRRATKKAKARGGAPAIPTSKKEQGTDAKPPEVSKAVVAQIVGDQSQGGGESSDETAARKAIEKMEKEEQDRIDERQARIDSVLAAKAATEGDPDAGSIPEIVANRMLKRMIPFFLLPAIGGVGVFVAVYVLSHQYDYTIPAYLVAYATQAPFLISLLGLTYAILSASWDEDREGTFFGADEAKRNFGNIVEGLRRSSDRMDVEDLMAEQEQQQKGNRSQRRQMRKEDDNQPGA